MGPASSTVANATQPQALKSGRPTPIDRDHLARFTFGSLPLELEVLALFAEQAPETLSMLAMAAPGKPWRDAAHTLKGSARAVGAWRIAAIAEAAEAFVSSAEAQQTGTLEALVEAVDEAISYIDGLSCPTAPAAA
jgi:HPt (histidine-containing phosphotransfer) domain-containing protein